MSIRDLLSIFLILISQGVNCTIRLVISLLSFFIDCYMVQWLVHMWKEKKLLGWGMQGRGRGIQIHVSIRQKGTNWIECVSMWERETYRDTNSGKVVILLVLSYLIFLSANSKRTVGSKCNQSWGTTIQCYSLDKHILLHSITWSEFPIE